MLDDLPTYSTFVIKFLEELNLLLKSYVFDGYTAMADYVKLPLASLATLYLVILGISVMNGWIKAGFDVIAKSALKIGLIFFIATNWGWVSEHIFEGINALISGVSGALISATPIPLPGVNNVNGALQEALITFVQLAGLFFKSASWTNPMALFEGLFMQGLGYMLIAIALFEIAMAQIMLAVLFVMLPLFVCCCLFESTKGFFDRYVGAIASNAILLMMVNAVLGLGLTFVFWTFPVLQGVSALNIGVVGMAPIFLISIIIMLTLKHVSSIANGIGGTICSASGSAMVAGVVGGMVGASMSGLKLGQKLGGSVKANFKKGVRFQRAIRNKIQKGSEK